MVLVSYILTCLICVGIYMNRLVIISIRKYLISIITNLSLIPKESKFKDNFNKTKSLFKQHLIKQFTKVIFKNSKYSSGIYGKIKGIFLERTQYKYFLEGIFLK